MKVPLGHFSLNILNISDAWLKLPSPTFVQSVLTSNAMKTFILPAFAVLFAGALADPKADPKAQALQQDDECAADNGGAACGLNALQLRSEEEPDSNFTNLDHIDPDDEQLLNCLTA